MATVRAQTEEDARRIDSLRTQNEEFIQRRADFEAQIKSLQGRVGLVDEVSLGMEFFFA